MRAGFFITIEGGEGAGKSSLIHKLAERLAEEGKAVTTTREPGGIVIAEKIRQLILDRAHTEMDARTEALLYAAARRQHLVEKIKPALTLNGVVLCDRFIDSSLAYQGIARKLGIAEVQAINHFAIDKWLPDLTLYLDVPPEIGLARIHADRSNQREELNRLDLEKIEFHRQVREGYHVVKQLYPERIVELDATKDAQTILDEALLIIHSRIPKR